jgi:hypothetical protein
MERMEIDKKQKQNTLAGQEFYGIRNRYEYKAYI